MEEGSPLRLLEPLPQVRRRNRGFRSVPEEQGQEQGSLPGGREVAGQDGKPPQVPSPGFQVQAGDRGFSGPDEEAGIPGHAPEAAAQDIDVAAEAAQEAEQERLSVLLVLDQPGAEVEEHAVAVAGCAW